MLRRIDKTYRTALTAILLLAATLPGFGADERRNDSIAVPDSAMATVEAYSDIVGVIMAKDSMDMKKQKNAFRKSDAKRAMWLGIVFPGAGQMYNRKYWKLPIIYGGFLGCLYAMKWNDMMYKDYSQAYMDIMDDNPATQSYNQFLHLGTTIDDSNIERYKTIFKKRKDYYRRYRDMSLFIMIGVYALSVIDAYVDASLSEFDISQDLSMKVAPAVMRNHSMSLNPLKSTSFGLQCSLTF